MAPAAAGRARRTAGRRCRAQRACTAMLSSAVGSLAAASGGCSPAGVLGHPFLPENDNERDALFAGTTFLDSPVVPLGSVCWNEAHARTMPREETRSIQQG